AIEARGAVSTADQALSGLAGGRSGDPPGDRHRSSAAGASASLSRRRLVLVPGQPGSNDWIGTNGGSGDGGSLCLHSVDRPFCDDDVAGGRLVKKPLALWGMARDVGGFLSAGARCPNVPASWVLARYAVILGAHAGAYSRQLRRRRQSRGGSVRAGQKRRECYAF